MRIKLDLLVLLTSVIKLAAVSVLEEVGKLPQLELYPEGKQFLHIISLCRNIEKHGETSMVLLCTEYKHQILYIRCRGKDAYSQKTIQNKLAVPFK